MSHKKLKENVGGVLGGGGGEQRVCCPLSSQIIEEGAGPPAPLFLRLCIRMTVAAVPQVLLISFRAVCNRFLFQISKFCEFVHFSLLLKY